MLKKNLKSLLLSSLVTILPVFIGIYLWNQLPDVMARHFSLDNRANGFSSKSFVVFGFPAILVAGLWFSAIVTSKDPRKQNISSKVFRRNLYIIPIASLFCSALIYSYNLGIKLDIAFFSMLFVGSVLIFIGNYLPKARQNYTIGIKLPWTLANEDNWNRTHRFAGFLYVIAGIIIVLTVSSGIMSTTWAFWFFIAVFFIPCIYSFILHAVKKM